MKQLTTKIMYVYLIYSNLKRTPPREYPDTNEMVVTVDEILPALKAASGQFIDFSKTAEEINNDVASNKMTQEEGRAKIDDLQKVVRAYEEKEGMEDVVVEFSASAFGILTSQFERWGKGNTEKQIVGWFNKIEDFVSFKKDISKVE